MNTPKQDNYHTYALPRLAEGIRKATSLVRETLGPSGRNVALESKLSPGHILTNDGATIIQAIELADPVEALGLGFLKEAVERSNNNSGDGSTTTTILLNAILEEGIKSGVNTLEIKRSLDECLPIIEKAIDEQTRKITVEDVPAVAEIAGESKELAKTLGDIYRVIGKDGIIHLEGSGTYHTEYTLIDGVRFGDTGYLSPYMAYDEEAQKAGKKEVRAVYKHPQILVTKKKIEHVKDIDPLLQALIAKGEKTLVVFTDDMDSNVARALIELQRTPSRSINVLIIKAPVLWKGYVFEDFAKITGATIVEDASGITFKNLQLDHLGSCETLLCDKEEVTVIGIKDIKDHVLDLEKQGTTDAKLRLSWLTTKTAILKLGAKSETELSYLRLKAEDAIHSSRLALRGGVVPGGGFALFHAADDLPLSIGGDILATALRAPLEQNCTNMGINIPIEGFDDEIIDASLIVKGAIRNALGIASTLLTTSSVVVLPPPSQEELLQKSIMKPIGF